MADEFRRAGQRARPSSHLAPLAPWFKRRLYPHFDAEVERGYKAFAAIRAYVSSPVNIARHRFAPFIHRVATVIRWKRPKVRSTTGPKRVPTRKMRPLCYVSHRDAHVMAFYAHLLKGPYERLLKTKQIAAHVLAYRSFTPRRSTIDFAGEVFAEVRKRGTCHTLLFDIEGFFDNLDHQILRDAWMDVLRIDDATLTRLPDDHYTLFRALTRYTKVPERCLKTLFPAFFDQPFPERSGKQICKVSEYKEAAEATWPHAAHTTFQHRDSSGNWCSRGIPQGTPISALLSNIYMAKFDELMRHLVESHDAVYRRYSDDILIISPSSEKSRLLEDALKVFIKDVGLKIQDKKTERWCFEPIDGSQDQTCTWVGPSPPPSVSRMQYLGLAYDGTTVRLRESGFNRYRVRLRRAVHAWRVATRKASKASPPYSVSKRRLFRTYSDLRTRHRAADHLAKSGNRRPIHPRRDPSGTYVSYAKRAIHLLETVYELDVTGIRRQIRDPLVRLDRAIRAL